MPQTVQILMEDKPGVLMRVIGIITAKGFNIVTMTVAPDPEQPGLACATLATDVEPRLQPRVVNELNRLVQVVRAW